jgi:hypothetical protein
VGGRDGRSGRSGGDRRWLDGTATPLTRQSLNGTSLTWAACCSGAAQGRRTPATHRAINEGGQVGPHPSRRGPNGGVAFDSDDRMLAGAGADYSAPLTKLSAGRMGGRGCEADLSPGRAPHAHDADLSPGRAPHEADFSPGGAPHCHSPAVPDFPFGKEAATITCASVVCPVSLHGCAVSIHWNTRNPQGCWADAGSHPLQLASGTSCHTATCHPPTHPHAPRRVRAWHVAADPCQRVCPRCLAAGRCRRGVVRLSRQSAISYRLACLHDESCAVPVSGKSEYHPTRTGRRAVLPTATAAGGTAAVPGVAIRRCDSKSSPCQCTAGTGLTTTTSAHNTRLAATTGAIAVRSPARSLARAGPSVAMGMCPGRAAPRAARAALGTRSRGTATLLATVYGATRHILLAGGCHPWCRSLRSGRLPYSSAATRFPRRCCERSPHRVRRPGTVRDDTHAPDQRFRRVCERDCARKVAGGRNRRYPRQSRGKGGATATRRIGGQWGYGYSPVHAANTQLIRCSAVGFKPRSISLIRSEGRLPCRLQDGACASTSKHGACRKHCQPCAHDALASY